MKTASKPGPEISNRQLVWRLLQLTWRYRWDCLRVLVTQLILLTASLAGIALTGLGIDELRYALDASTRPPAWPLQWSPPAHWTPLQILSAIAVAVVLLATARMGLAYLNGVWFGKLLQGRLVVDLRVRCYDKLQRLNFRFFDANTTSSLINRVAGDIQSVRLFVDGVLFQVVILLVSVASFLAYMLAIHPGLTFACLASTPLVWLGATIFSRTVRPAYKRSSELFDRLVERLAESIRGIQVIKAFAREPAEWERFQKANDTLRDSQHWIFARVSTFVPGLIFLSQANLIVLLAYGGWLALHGKIGVGTGLVGFAAILQQFSTQISSIGNIANSMQQCLRAAQRVFEVLDAPLPIQSPSTPIRLGRIRGLVSFQNVTLAHGGEPLLQGIHFAVQPGECIAIVGPTGSGKSSLLSLIPRFYDPAEGRVCIDGVDVRDLALDDLRRSVATVFQESFLFSTTVAANIAFGHPEASQEQIEKAAKIASAHDFILSLPDGYNTVLGEAGVGLSGGQKQRLAIARALLLEPSILLLDDPTASLDPGTENEIVEAMESAMAGRTTFLVAHRPSILRRATRILVLERGRMVQMGTHRELMSQPGYYAESARLQLDGIHTWEEEGAR
ncbi:MAG: hypothetical protein RLZZ399_2434 [Verrucomicrobiota bacterium]